MNNDVVNYYDSIARDYDRSRFSNTYGTFIDAEERAILHALDVGHMGERTLELACGTGRLLDFATAGADASAEMLAEARRKYHAKRLVQAPAHELPFDNGSFDTIYCFHLMMHLDTDYIVRVLAEAHRVLALGGRLIFDFPSLTRREKLKRIAPDGWHGNTSLSSEMVRKMAGDQWEVRRRRGILFLPIHKVKPALRSALLGIDKLLCASPLKEMASYVVIELVKK